MIQTKKETNTERDNRRKRQKKKQTNTERDKNTFKFAEKLFHFGAQRMSSLIIRIQIDALAVCALKV